jgi:FKBP-type peptidyl-prolyl cis-trans isomerase 2
VHEVRDDTIVLDFNSLLAGKTLTFDIRIISLD